MNAKRIVILVAITTIAGSLTGCQNGGLFRRNQQTSAQQPQQQQHPQAMCPPGTMPGCMPIQSAQMCPPVCATPCP